MEIQSINDADLTCTLPGQSANGSAQTWTVTPPWTFTESSRNGISYAYSTLNERTADGTEAQELNPLYVVGDFILVGELEQGRVWRDMNVDRRQWVAIESDETPVGTAVITSLINGLGPLSLNTTNCLFGSGASGGPRNEIEFTYSIDPFNDIPAIFNLYHHGLTSGAVFRPADIAFEFFCDPNGDRPRYPAGTPIGAATAYVYPNLASAVISAKEIIYYQHEGVPGNVPFPSSPAFVSGESVELRDTP